MDSMTNGQSIASGRSNEANQPTTGRAGECGREPLPVARREERRDVAGQPRKTKRRRPRAVEQQHIAPPPQKPIWPVIVGAILIVLYICSPVDIIPDVPVIGAWDDIALAVFGLRKLDKRRKENEAAQRPFRHNGDERMWHEENHLPRHSVSSQQDYAMAPPMKPGFFARVMKAVSIIFGGDE
jgi:uncharacterized membrane protein YkvA (DUF1232 family)